MAICGRMHLTPRGPGRSAPDLAKVTAMRVWSAARHARPGSKAER